MEFRPKERVLRKPSSEQVTNDTWLSSYSRVPQWGLHRMFLIVYFGVLYYLTNTYPDLFTDFCFWSKNYALLLYNFSHSWAHSLIFWSFVTVAIRGYIFYACYYAILSPKGNCCNANVAIAESPTLKAWDRQAFW